MASEPLSLMQEIKMQRRLLVLLLVLLGLGAMVQRVQRAMLFPALSAVQPAAFTANPIAGEAAPIANLQPTLGTTPVQPRANLFRPGGAVPPAGDAGTTPLFGLPGEANPTTPTAGPGYSPDITLPGQPNAQGPQFLGRDVLPVPGGSVGGGGVTPQTTTDPGAPAVPEPESWLTLLIGMVGVGAYLWRQQRRAALA